MWSQFVFEQKFAFIISCRLAEGERWLVITKLKHACLFDESREREREREREKVMLTEKFINVQIERRH